MKALPEKYREAIHLYYYEGYSTGQMAVLLESLWAMDADAVAEGIMNVS